MTQNISLSKDDVFLLGNAALLAINNKISDDVTPISDVIREARPDNAGAEMIEALAIAQSRSLQEAIDYLGSGEAFKKERNGDEALLLFLSFLVRNGEIERANDLANQVLEASDDLPTHVVEELEFYSLISLSPEEFEEMGLGG